MLSLVRSGNGTRESIELLLKPIANSESIVKITGLKEQSPLPLHVACEYNVNFEIMEQLLRSYPEGARKPCDGLYALNILENPKKRFKSTEEDNLAKSDLLFVHYPQVAALDETRIQHLADRIIKEIKLHHKSHESPSSLKLSLTSYLAWNFFVTANPRIEVDEILSTETTVYRQAVEKILEANPSVEYADYLSKIPLVDHDKAIVASYNMKNLVLSRVRFCGK